MHVGVDRGFVLLPVIMLIAVLAAVTLLLSQENASNLAVGSREAQVDAAAFVAEAGLRHASWLTSVNETCKDYTALQDIPFGEHSYSVSLSSTSGSPVSFSATGVLANGATHALGARQVTVYVPSTTTLLQPGANGLDTYLRDGASGAMNYGASSFLGMNNQSAEQVSLLKFDLSAIPANALVESVTLELWLEGGGAVNNAVIDLHRMEQDWIEGNLDGDAPPAGAGATYNSYNGQVSWASVGGDYETTPTDTIVIPALVPGWHEWDLTPLAAGWIAGTAANSGVLLRASSGVADQIEFTSSDGVAAQRPKLTLTYRCECGTQCVDNGSLNLLFVVGDDASLTTEETEHRTLVESWGYTVELIDDNATQTEFDAAVANNKLAFITNDIVASNLGTKLLDATIGVVTSEVNLSDDFGLASSVGWDSGTALVINDNSQYVTTPFATGPLTVLSTNESLAYVTGTLAPGLEPLASSSSGYGVVTMEAGAALYSGGTAAGRRVQLPWGGANFNPTSLNSDGLTLLQRALEWAAGADTGAAAAGAIAHWKLDDGGALTAVDSAGTNDGTLTGGPAWTAGKLDGALDFDGVNDYVDAGSFDVSGDGLTMIAWFKADTLPTSDGRFVSKADGPNEADAWWQLGSTDSGSNRYVRMRIKAGGVTTTMADASENLVTGRWYLAVGTYDSTSGAMTLYLDGAEVASGLHATGGTVDTDPAVPVAIGANGTPERFFDGTLDDVRVYDRALTAAQITELFAAGGGCTAIAQDSFNAESYAGSDADPLWVSDWTEFGDSGSPDNGDERVIADTVGFKLQIADNDSGGFGGRGEGVWREVNLSGASSATLSFKYERSGLDDADDAGILFVSGDGGANWSPELWRTEGPGSDADFQEAEIDISAYIAPDTRIRFQTGTGNAGGDKIFFDDIKICTN